MRFLIISLLGLVVSCTTYPKRNGFTALTRDADSLSNPYFSNEALDYVYKADIQAFGRSFGGIFIVKKQGRDQHRIAFTTELGNTIFDFTVTDTQFKVNHILEELDRKPLLNVLRKDFVVLIKEGLTIEKSFEKEDIRLYQTRIETKNHFYLIHQGHLQKIIKVKNGKSKVEFLFSKINGDLAKHIQIKHNNLDLAITLKAL